MLLNLLLIFCAGYTFSVGGINLAIGFYYKQDRSYLLFGLISLFASIFLIAQISTIYTQSPAFSNTLSIITACFFYSLFVWFIGEYTQFKIRSIQIGITLLFGFNLIAYFLRNVIGISGQALGVLAHLSILLISIYGIAAGIKSHITFKKVRSIIYTLMMVMLFVLTILVGTGSYYNIQIIPDPQGFISPLDFFPVFFSILVGSKMSHDIARTYQLERQVRQKDREWSALMDTINLLIVKLDLNGKVTWVNTHFLNFSGYKEYEIIGKDWFEIMARMREKNEMKGNFLEYIDGQDSFSYQNKILLKSGESKSIQWSNIRLQSEQNEFNGVLSIGADVTERESRIEQIKSLKDQLEKENLLLKEEVSSINASTDIIGQSDSLIYVVKRAHQVAGTDSTVLLEGETGVGKELFANMIHQNSRRRHRQIIKVNCASLPKDLIESELFGHEKGSFTGALKRRIGRFELADKGTIFLDEIGELPIDLQPKLLRVLQSGEFERIGSEQTIKVDVRVVAATNRNLQEESEKGSFRQDLFFRLNVYPITIPPLRQRVEDIPMLIKHFTSKIGSKIGRKIKHISKADINKLQAYSWPGNVRELENVLERAIINSKSETIKLDDEQLRSQFSDASPVNGLFGSTATLSNSQKNHILNVLNRCDWKINGDDGAAAKLGMPPSTLRSKMKKLGIKRPNNN
jgi:PAS domain S-box-containing protein